MKRLTDLKGMEVSGPMALTNGDVAEVVNCQDSRKESCTSMANCKPDLALKPEPKA